MGESSFTIQISTNLVDQLADDSGKLKRKTRKAKPKLPQDAKTPQQSLSKQKQVSDDSKILKVPPAAGWPLQPPLYLPPPPVQPANAELEAIQSVLKESENVVEKLQKQEADMLQEVTERAKDLHAKEFKLPQQKPVPCLEKYEACLKCYEENTRDSLRCQFLVNDYADCVRKIRRLVSSEDK
ncbi:MICOS complex subunit MIC19 [Coffea eugenioides]|uniref:MICOS complex subunit mic25a-like n=1 Tax=Coffea arabica TaxID=13443 RepID=A0ABM4VE59_COFAR|nr:MICOS complex subunit MIC19 [Coffea eugenioides]